MTNIVTESKKGVKPHQNHWLITKGNISLFSPTPKFIGLSSLKSFSNRFERFFRIKEGDVCLDVGACIGDTTLPTAIKTGPKGTVIAIEPEPYNLKFLQMNLATLKNSPSIVIIPKAAWNHKETVRFNVYEIPTAHSIIDRTTTFIQVQADTLDNMLKDWDRIDFAKIDVQGAELEVLQGAEEMLRKTKRLVVETHYHGEKALYPKVAAFLELRGFKVKVTSDRIVHAWRPTK